MKMIEYIYKRTCLMGKKTLIAEIVVSAGKNVVGGTNSHIGKCGDEKAKVQEVRER